MNLEQCKEICSKGWPSNQQEQARFDAEQWLIQEVERLQIELSSELNEGFNMASDYFGKSLTTSNTNLPPELEKEKK